MTDPAREAYDQELRQRAIGSVRLASLLAIASFASFALVDPLLVDGSIRPLLIARGAGIALLVALAASTLLGPVFLRWSQQVAIATCMVTGLLVIVLTLLTGGGTSDYHEALIITFFAFAMLPLPWSSITAGSVFATLVVTYEVVMMVADVTGPLGGWVSNNAILWASALIAAAIGHFSMQLRWDDFKNRTQLAAARDRLEALDRAKSRFFANISHELRTPLTLALAPVQALLEEAENLTEDQIQNLQLVERNALRLLRLVNDLLELSRADAATLKVRPQPIPIRQVIEGLVAETAPLASRKALSLQLADGDPVPPLHADPEHVERILLNVLANAVKFTPRGGAIVISVRQSDDGVQIAVQDTGIGIPADQLEAIFDRFHQVDSSGTRNHGGTGIGLALVRELVGLNGGSVAATSAPGDGTCITINLPVSTPDLADARAEPVGISAESGLPEWHAAVRRQDAYRLRHLQDATERRLVPRGLGGSLSHTVLVVEDNRDMVRFVAALLASEANVLTATDGLTGLRLAREKRPDLIISDVMMPGMDGLQLVQQLRSEEATRTTPMILMTARDSDDDRVEGRRAGADTYLAKPFRAAELREAVRSLLKREGASKAQARQDRMESIRYLAGGIMDELRAPLDAIDESLSDRSPTDSLPNVQSVQAELDRLRSALEGLERFAVGGAGLREPQVVSDIVRRATHAAQASAGDRRLELQLGPCSDVAAAAGELERLVTHLLTNAFEATRPGGTVTVRNWQAGDRVFLSVTDEGPGIPLEAAERIFAPYYSTREGARGMGLALSRRLAERCGGRLELAAGGPGATFVLELPAESALPD